MRGPVILMYHAFGRTGEPASRFVLPRRRFLLQLLALRLLRRRVVGLDEHVRRVAEGEPPAPRTVVITIDDGYLDNYELAFPILRRFGYPATIFLVSRCVGGTNTWDDVGELAGRPLFGWDAAREMARGGISFGAHTRTHPNLPGLAPDEARTEIAGSRQDLEAELGAPVELFTYPYGRWDVTAVEAVREAGFVGACTAGVDEANAGNPLLLDRIEIVGDRSVLRFAARLLL